MTTDRRYADNAVSRTVARRIQTLRTARGWSAVDLADRIVAWGYPISANTVRFIESGRRRVVTIDEFVAIAAIFDVPHADLLDGSCSACKGTPPIGFTCNNCGRAAS